MREMENLLQLLVSFLLYNLGGCMIITSTNSDQKVENGNLASLTVTLRDYSDTVTGQWFMTDLTGTERAVTIDQQNNHLTKQLPDISLHITSVDKSYTGRYVYRATDGNRTVDSPPITLSVSGIPIQVGTTMTTESVTLGQTINLTCDYLPKGSRDISVTWSKDVNYDETFINGSSNSRYNGSTPDHPSLIITDIQTEDIGDYFCKVGKKPSFGRSTTITLILAEVSTQQVTTALTETFTTVQTSTTVNVKSTTEYVTDLTSQDITNTTNGIPATQSTTTQYVTKITGHSTIASTSTTSTSPSSIIITTETATHKSDSPTGVTTDQQAVSTEPTVNSESLCPCDCDFKEKLEYWARQNLTNYTMEELRIILRPALDKLEEELKVDKKQLSSTIRRLTSAKDDRPSSKSLGSFGVIFLVVVIALVVISDLISFKQFIHNVRQMGKLSSPSKSKSS